MTRANGYLGKREFHGALARHSPYRLAPVRCLGPCGKTYASTCEIIDELCNGCFLAGWRLDPGSRVLTRMGT
jgi:hypothetical protein